MCSKDPLNGNTILRGDAATVTAKVYFSGLKTLPLIPAIHAVSESARCTYKHLPKLKNGFADVAMIAVNYAKAVLICNVLSTSTN
jgi:hypothetical protein